MRFIIDFHNDVSRETVDAYLASEGCELLRVYDALGNIFLVGADKEPTVTDIVERVTRDDADPIQLLEDQTVTITPMSSKQHETASDDNWWKVAVVQDVDYESSEFATTETGKGVRVYMLDSGLADGHSEFAGRDVTLLHTLTDNFTDTTGHGTALSSAVIGKTCGLTVASLLVVKIFEKDTATYISDLLAAFNAVADDYMANSSSPAVVNLSWSIPRNTYVEDKITALMEMGMIISAAAGNSGQPVSDVTPAGMEKVCTVGSFGMELTPSDFTNYTGSDTSTTAGETNHGGALDLFAPGEQIRIALPDGGFGYTAGTSAAAAVYSAVLASEISRANVTYDRMDYSGFIPYIHRQSRSRDLLTLEGKYADSPNVTPRTDITPLDARNRERRTEWPSRVLTEKGARFSRKIFDAASFTEATMSGALGDWVMDENWLLGTAPTDGLENGIRTDLLKFTLSNGQETIEYDFHVVTYDAEQHDIASAEEESNLGFHSACCPNSDVCCGIGCPKTGNCDSPGDCTPPGFPCN